MHPRYAPLLLIGMLVFLTGCSRPPSATGIVHFKYEPQDQAEATLRTHLPSDTSVELTPITNTELFQITIRDVNSARAADRVNLLLIDIQRSVKAAHPDAGFMVWEQATPNP